MKIFQCGIYKKGYKEPDQSITFYFGMGLDNLYNYTHDIRLFEEEDLFEEIEVEISNINESDAIETKKVKGYKFLVNDNDTIAIPFRVFYVEKAKYIHPFYT